MGEGTGVVVRGCGSSAHCPPTYLWPTFILTASWWGKWPHLYTPPPAYFSPLYSLLPWDCLFPPSSPSIPLDDISADLPPPPPPPMNLHFACVFFYHAPFNRLYSHICGKICFFIVPDKYFCYYKLINIPVLQYSQYLFPL
jgi:hypothetical protein